MTSRDQSSIDIVVGGASWLAGETFKRIYAVAMIGLVAYLSYLALHYLVTTLMIPTPPPAQITGVPLRMSHEILDSDLSDWRGIQAAEIPRMPVAHYHRISGWLQPDRFNTCTTSGCHNMLAHSKHKATRAFLNMHAANMQCGVCHLESATPLPLTWYSLDDGQATDPPAMLRLFAWLLEQRAAGILDAPTLEFHTELMTLLDQMVAQARQSKNIVALADEVRAPRYTSDQFVTLVHELLHRLPQFFHSRYGAKLALRDPRTGQPLLDGGGDRAAIRQVARGELPEEPAARAALFERVHPGHRAATLDCHACHTQEESIVDLTTVGYPAPRITALREGFIFGAIERIAAGHPLYLPTFLQPDNTAPEPREP